MLPRAVGPPTLSSLRKIFINTDFKYIDRLLIQVQAKPGKSDNKWKNSVKICNAFFSNIIFYTNNYKQKKRVGKRDRAE